MKEIKFTEEQIQALGRMQAEMVEMVRRFTEAMQPVLIAYSRAVQEIARAMPCSVHGAHPHAGMHCVDCVHCTARGEREVSP